MRLADNLRRYAAAPARAREVIRENTESLAGADAIESPGGAPELDRIAELRRRVQQNRYQVDVEQLCRKMIEKHLSARHS